MAMKQTLHAVDPEKIFILYDNLTRVELRNTYVENILCV